MTENPFNPNITFTISEVKEHNPFTPILGQGGYNSGKKINNSDTNLPVDSVEREKVIWANAQRTYRNRNRDAYNANMLNLWKKNKEENNESYKNWLLNQTKANEKYRLKKKLIKLQGVNYNDLKTVPSKIKTAVDKIWKFKPKSEKDALSKKQKKSVKQAKAELYKEEFEKTRLKEIETIKAKLGNNTEIKDIDTPVNYAQVDYTDLAVGKDPNRKANNLQDLNTYYNTVITKKSAIPTGTVFKEKPRLNIKKLREAHRNNLHAGDWTLEGQYKRKSGNPSNRPEGERYEKKGENKI
jgi:hypothetical protein